MLKWKGRGPTRLGHGSAPGSVCEWADEAIFSHVKGESEEARGRRGGAA